MSNLTVSIQLLAPSQKIGGKVVQTGWAFLWMIMAVCARVVLAATAMGTKAVVSTQAGRRLYHYFCGYLNRNIICYIVVIPTIHTPYYNYYYLYK